jgi:hypothetical protein
MCAQAIVLIMQRRRGPRCLVPARWLPPKHDYFKLTAAPHHRSGSGSVGSAGGLVNAQADSSSSSSSSQPFGAAIASYFGISSSSSSSSDSSAGSARGEYHRVNIDAFGSGGNPLDDDSAIELADASLSASSSASASAASSASSSASASTTASASAASSASSFVPIVEQCACCLEDLDPSLNELPFDDADFDDAADAQRAIEVVRADSIHHSSASASSSSASSSSASSSSAFAFASSSTSVNSGAPVGLAFSDSHRSASASSSSASSSSPSSSSLTLSATEIAARRVMQTPCGHRFHAACLRQWMCAQLHQTCPTCRGFLPLE